MNKADLVSDAWAKTGLSREVIADVVQRLLDHMMDAIVAEGRIELRGFGTFSVRERGAHPARHPRTRQIVHVSARKTVFFKASKCLKGRMNQ